MTTSDLELLTNFEIYYPLTYWFECDMVTKCPFDLDHTDHAMYLDDYV